MDALQLKQAIIGGHSMGGQITLRLYQRAPERFRGMLLIDTNAFPPAIIEQAQWHGYAYQAQQQGVASFLPSLLPQLLTGETRQNDPELVTELSNIIDQASLNGAVGGAKALAQRPDLSVVLPTITVPTLVLVGLEDPLYSFEISQKMQAAIPNSQLAIIPGGSHATILEKANEADDAIRSWAQQSLSNQQTAR